MFKKLGLVLAVFALVLMVYVPQAQAKYGLVKWDYGVIDENDWIITNTVTVYVYTASTDTLATIYADENATAKTNPWTITDGSVVFYSSVATLDVKVKVDNRGARLVAVGADDTHRIKVPLQALALKGDSEVLSASDTLTIYDAGKTIISTGVVGTEVFTLPAATSANMRFSFIDGKASTTNTFSVDPSGTNKIIYSISGVPLDAGDKITSTGQSGDSVTLISDASGNWYIESMKGNFTDGGA